MGTNNLEEQKQEAITIVVASCVLLNDWLPTLKNLYRKTVNPLLKNGKPKITPFENKLNTFENSCNNFLNYFGWTYGENGATKEYEAICQLGELILQLQALPDDKRKEVDGLIEKYYYESKTNQ